MTGISYYRPSFVHKGTDYVVRRLYVLYGASYRRESGVKRVSEKPTIDIPISIAGRRQREKATRQPCPVHYTRYSVAVNECVAVGLYGPRCLELP